MFATTKIVFPPPPPTTNSLSSLERSRLLRKTKKLERVLGSAPHFIDDPLVLDLPFSGDSESIPSRPSTSSRSSVDSSRSLYRVTSIDRPRSRSMPSRRLSVEEPWPSSKPPLMKLSKSPGPLPSIPASPLAANSFSPSATMTPPDSPMAPEFIIPSHNSLRRQKMDRLRRKLGDGVPVDLVFPKQRESVVVQAKVEEKFIPVLLSPPPVPPKPLQSRDSMSYPSPHRAVRKVKRKPVPYFDLSELDAPLPPYASPFETRRRTLSLSSSSSECNSPASEYSEKSFLWDIPEESAGRQRSFWTSVKRDLGREEDSEWLEVTYSKELGLTVSSPP